MLPYIAQPIDSKLIALAAIITLIAEFLSLIELFHMLSNFRLKFQLFFGEKLISVDIRLRPL